MIRTRSLTEGVTTFTLILNMPFFYMMYETLESEEDFQKILKVLLAGLVMVLGVGMYKLINNQYSHFIHRYFILYYEQVQALNLLGIFALISGLDRKKVPGILGGIVVYLLCAILIFLSGIRTIMLSAVGSLIFTLIMHFKYKKRNLSILILVILTIALSLVFAYQKVSAVASQVSSGSLERIQNISLKTEDLSIIFRFISYKSAIATALAHPLLGIGFSSGYFMDILGIRYFTYVIDNSYIKLAMSGGLLMSALYIYVLVVLYKSSFQLLKKVHSGREGVMVVTFFSIIVMANLADCFETNISYVRVMPIVAFAWAGLMKIKDLTYNSAFPLFKTVSK
jgi:hypothetical protein